MRRNTAFQGTLNRPGPTPTAASHDNPRSFFRDARFFGEIGPLGRNAGTPGNVANTVHVHSSFRYEAQARAVATNQLGLLRNAGSFDRPRSIRRNAATPENVANTVHVRRSRGYEAPEGPGRDHQSSNTHLDLISAPVPDASRARGTTYPQGAGNPGTASAPRGARTRGRRRCAQRRRRGDRRWRRLLVHR